MRILYGLSAAVLLVSLSAAGGQPTHYRNPILAGDYSDPDAIRVGEDYYLVSSSFSNAPGLPILHSRDLVHWKTIGYGLNTLPPEAHFRTPRHGGGAWAPAIRYHNGAFVLYYPDPDVGVFRVTAQNPAGPWSAPELVLARKGAIDPCPFWDDDGSAWLVNGWAYSRAGINNVITLTKLTPDGSKAVGEGIPIIDASTLPPVSTANGTMPWMTTEGPKLYKRNGWYYVFVPSGGVPGGWQGVLRSRKLTGPYEGRNVLDQGATPVNGPHQGAWVTTDSGEDWFLHFQDYGAYGRRLWLEPMAWKNDWPVIGLDKKHTGHGEPVLTWRMPRAGTSSSDALNDEFDGRIDLQWQWNANPAADWADMTAAPGALRLKSTSFPENLWEDGAILTRKMPAERFTVTAKVTFQPKRVGERTGLVFYGKDYAWVGLEQGPGGLSLVQVVRKSANLNGAETKAVSLPAFPATVYLRGAVEPVTIPQPVPEYAPYWPSVLKTVHLRIRFSYSFDGKLFTPVGSVIDIPPGVWVGAQLGLFAQAPSGTPSYSATTVGWADYDWVRFEVGSDAARE